MGFPPAKRVTVRSQRGKPFFSKWERKNPMRMPSQMKPILWGAAAGAVVWWGVRAVCFGGTGAGPAMRLANASAEKAVVAALAPICAERFNAQADTTAMRVKLKDTSSWPIGRAPG